MDEESAIEVLFAKFMSWLIEEELAICYWSQIFDEGEWVRYRTQWPVFRRFLDTLEVTDAPSR